MDDEEQIAARKPVPTTIEGIVADVITKLSTEDKAFITNGTMKDARGMHFTLGMWIRNHYGLWHTSPLTEGWRTKPETHDIQGDVDCSKDHPDQMSDTIIQALWNKLNGV